MVNISQIQNIPAYTAPDMTNFSTPSTMAGAIQTTTESVFPDWYFVFLLVVWVIGYIVLTDEQRTVKLDSIEAAGVISAAMTVLAAFGLVLSFANDWSNVTIFGALTFIFMAIKYIKK